MFCPTCKSLLTRTAVRGRPTSYCAQCDGKGTSAEPVAWWQKKSKTAGQTTFGSEAARVAVQARPHVPASVRAKPRDEAAPARRPREIPPPEKLEVPSGMDLFPFDSVRAGQREFIADVAETAERGGHLLAHAPTGLGKTVSTLAPLVAHALAKGQRVIFLTSKQSQHKIAIDTLKAVREKVGVPFVVADVIGKKDMCPRREARELYSKRFAEFCRREQVSRQCEYWENGNAPAIKLLKSRVHSVEELVMTCTDAVTCPHQAALDLAAQAHVVVCDYNYLFSNLRENMQERLRLELSDVLLVVDEAHNLPDRIRDHLTLSLSDFVLNDALEEAKDVNDATLTRDIELLGEVLAEMAERSFDRDGEPGSDRMSRGERYVPRGDFVDAVNDALTRRRGTLTSTDYEGLVSGIQVAADAFEENIKDDSRGLRALHEFLTNWKIERRGLARVLTQEPSPKLNYQILDPSVLSKPVFDGVAASVVMSGTLHPMEMMRDVLGLDPARTILREYDSPFPQENRLVLIDSSVTTGYKERTPQMFADIGERLAGIALATPGNVAAFFPSYGILEQVRPHVELALESTRKDLVVEERGFDKSEKEALVTTMRHQTADALLLGVQGGSLSEGYDYADNMLKGVVIVGLPFAAPTLEVEALIEYYDKKFGPGHGRPYAYVHPAFHRVLQAAGRSIRSPTDRGVIVLMDKRFAWGTYRASYPKDFRPRPTNDPVREITGFWNPR